MFLQLSMACMFGVGFGRLGSSWQPERSCSFACFIFGFAPYVYWKTGRAPATRYLNTIHFKPLAVPRAERDELVTSLLRNPPELFLVETADRYTSQGNTNDDSRP